MLAAPGHGLSEAAQTNQMIIYRIQDKAGRGPYKPGFRDSWVYPHNEGIGKEPWNKEFGLKIIRGALYGQAFGCGFRTLDQLHRWFWPSELERLCQLGYSIVEMDVDTILAESETQLVFARNKPLKEDVRTISIMTVTSVK